MFSIKDIGNNDAAKDYYQHEDYYTKETVGSVNDKQWLGKAAKELGLEDEQFKEQLKQILNGRVDALNIKVGNKKHIPGYDLTFSPPKSVSIQSEVVGDTRIREAHTQAVKAVLEYIESSKMIYTRKTLNGKTHYENIDKLAFGLVLHNTSRALDPQLHTHAILANMVQRSDGVWRSGCFEKLYENQQMLKRMYRIELAHLLTNLGYTIEVKNQKEGLFEIKEVPKSLISKFSTRRKAIEKALEQYEYVNAKTAANVTLITRQAKQEISREELHKNWEKVISGVGINLEELRKGIPKAIKREASINLDEPIKPIDHNITHALASEKSTNIGLNYK